MVGLVRTSLIFYLTVFCERSQGTGNPSDDVIRMRILSDPVSLSNVLTNLVQEEDEEASLTKVERAAPNPFSGPEHFSQLVGQCFTYQKANFEYRLCPFQNATQKETSFAHNRQRFLGVIGIWYEWTVEDDSLSGWTFERGDSCGGSKVRSTTVDFSCGDSFALVDVTEPVQCHYQMTFKLPQACQPDSLLIYPIISDPLRLEWDILEAENAHGELTEKGYRKRVRKIFMETGLLQKDNEPAPLETSFVAPVVTTKKSSGSSILYAGAGPNPRVTSSSQFTDLQQCQEAYDALPQRISLYTPRNGTGGST